MAKAYIGVGSNIAPEENIIKAVRLLGRKVRITGISTVYRTAPEGSAGQPDYFNCVIGIETEMSPPKVRQNVLRPIENDLGRERSGDKNAPRTIDLDLVLYDDLTAETDEFTLPDPLILTRAFLAFPLCELAPDLVLPGSGLPIKVVVAGLRRDAMKPLREFTELLKKEVLHAKKEE